MYTGQLSYWKISSLSLCLSLFLSLSSSWSSPDHPRCINISYEGSGMIPGWFIRLYMWFRFLVRSNGRTDEGVLRGPRGHKKIGNGNDLPPPFLLPFQKFIQCQWYRRPALRYSLESKAWTLYTPWISGHPPWQSNRNLEFFALETGQWIYSNHVKAAISY